MKKYLLTFLFLLSCACGDSSDKIIAIQEKQYREDSLLLIQITLLNGRVNALDSSLWIAVERGLYIDSLQTSKLKELYNYLNTSYK